jgi:hypothetical protein
MPFPKKARGWWCILPSACRTSPTFKQACPQRVDADGNGLRKIRDLAIGREVQALDNREQFQSRTRAVDDHSTESVAGVNKIEALGALKRLSGDRSAWRRWTICTRSPDGICMCSWRRRTTPRSAEISRSVLRGDVEVWRGRESQRFEAPKIWIGSSGVKGLRVLGELLDVVEQMNSQRAGHTHGSPPPSNNAAFTTAAASAKGTLGMMKPIAQ